MVDFSLNSNINQKKNLLKTNVQARQNEVKTQDTANTAAVATSAKTTEKEVVSGLTNGTMSASKAVSALKTKSPVKATKKVI